MPDELSGLGRFAAPSLAILLGIDGIVRAGLARLARSEGSETSA